MICKRCRGAGNLMRPTDTRRLNFVRCTDCRGVGVKTNPEILRRSVAGKAIENRKATA